MLHDLPVAGRPRSLRAVGGRLTTAFCQLIMVVPHTFGGYLNFNCHLHILVSAVACESRNAAGISSARFNKRYALMRALALCRLITYLREASQKGTFFSWTRRVTI